MRSNAVFALLAFAVSTFCPQAHSAESIDEYVAALDNELHATEQSSSMDKPPSLDAERLLRQSDSLIHSATQKQTAKLVETFSAFAARRIVPVSVSPIPSASEYLAFTEVNVIFAEILDRIMIVQRAGRTVDDAEMLEGLRRRACSAPSTTDFYRGILDAEIAGGRYLPADLPQARAVSARLVQRVSWYVSAENLSTCRNFSRIKVAP